MDKQYNDLREGVKATLESLEPQGHYAIARVIAAFDGRISDDVGEGENGSEGALAGRKAGNGTTDPSLYLLRNKCDKDGVRRERLSGKEMRSKDLCCRTIEAAVGRFGWGSSVVLCLTDGGMVGDERAASRRFKNLWDGYFARLGYRGYVRVIERGEKTGRVHIHALVVAPEGASVGYRDGFDRLHRSKWFRGQQGGFNKVSRAYGFGIEQYEVIKKSALSVGRYFGKYASKGIGERYTKGVRVWSCSRSLAIGSVTKTGSATAGGWAWRLKLKTFCESKGIKTEEQAVERWGAAWKYTMSALIRETIIPGELEFASAARARVMKADLPMEVVGGKKRYGVWDEGKFWDLVFPCKAKTLPFIDRELRSLEARLLAEDEDKARLQDERDALGLFAAAPPLEAPKPQRA